MILILKLISIVMIVYGCLLVVKPKLLQKRIIDYISVGNRIYIANGIKVVIGVIMMMTSSSCTVSWFVLFLGALTVLSAIAVFFLKRRVITNFLEKIKILPRKKVFMLGCVVIALGGLLILSI